MTLAHAKALLPTETIIEAHDPVRDQKALASLAIRAMRFSPIVAIDPPHGLLLDISGCQQVHRGEARILRSLLGGVATLGFSARGAIASTFACARAVAQYGSRPFTIVPASQQRQAMQDLPIEGLIHDLRHLDALEEIGIQTIGQVLALPRAQLASRFGEELARHLDRALGQAFECIVPIRPVEAIRVERAWEGSTTRIETIELVVRELLAEMAEQLQAREQGVRLLILTLSRPGSASVHTQLSLSRPTRRIPHLWSLLRLKVERLHLGFGVDRVELLAARTGTLAHEQLEEWTGADMDAATTRRATGELIDALTSRLGGNHILRVVPTQTHIPERVFRYIPVGDQPLEAKEPGYPAPLPVTPNDRPSVLFDPPSPATAIALMPDLPPSQLHWEGAVIDLLGGSGPERIECEWWHGKGAFRDYYRVQDSTGRWLWVFREGETARWFVHGVWA